jgi:excinuclease ABC subunit A
VERAELLSAVVLVDQTPIGRTPRSNPVTYIKAFDEIRKLYAGLPRAKTLGLTPGHFSFNVKGGRCEACSGDGLRQVEMHFLPDVYVTCDACSGKRYSRETLEVRFRGLSIADALDLTVDEASDLLESIPRIAQKLVALRQVGLGYIQLGQPATTLSGGEAQRLKIARELAQAGKRDGRKLYILDEPTTGLHLDDVRVLIQVLDRLVDAGHTVVVIEHHMDVVKRADWIVDLGPEAGDAGGRVVVQGTPEQVAAVEASHTGRYLRPLLHPAPEAALAI